MAKIRNVSDEARVVGYGIPYRRTVQPDEVFEVDDAAAESYAHQPTIFDVVPALAPSAPKEDTE